MKTLKIHNPLSKQEKEDERERIVYYYYSETVNSFARNNKSLDINIQIIIKTKKLKLFSTFSPLKNFWY